MQFKAQFLPAICIAFLGSALALGSQLDAYIYSFLSAHHDISHSSFWLSCVAAMLIALVPILFFSRFTHIHTPVAIFLYFIYVILFLMALTFIFNLWFPPVKLLLATFISYLLWCAFKAKALQSSIDVALHSMRNELISLGMEPEDELRNCANSSQQARVSKLMLTMQHLRDLHKSKNDALMFISHDIRTPLSAAIVLLDKFEKTKHTTRMHQLLARASVMAEGFVHASRAESADVNKFKVIDMVSLTKQVIDDLYDLINAKQLTLEADFPEDNVWVRGDFGLLFRTVSNVLLNAVNYSPDNSAVKISLISDACSLELKIIDHGPGIPENNIPKLFKRFSRVDGEYQAFNGCGLGLYFVNITVKKHRGSVAVRNVADKGAEFLIRLPLERRKVNLHVLHERRVEVQS